MKITGAEMIVKALELEGVQYVFGVPGGTVIPLYDSLYDSSLRHVLSRHEQGACFMASGYARVSGKTGVCIATSGPGATNTITALADAYADSIPLVVITGQVKRSLRGRDAFQEADLFGSTMSMVKHSYYVSEIEDLPMALKGAFYLASTGRPGPVLLDIPVDVQGSSGDFDYSKKPDLPGYRPVDSDSDHKFFQLAKMIDNSERPLLLVGGGVVSSGASHSLSRFANVSKIPVANTLMGKGAFDERSDLSVGMVGMHGTVAANKAVMSSDLIIAVGCRFSDRTTGNVEKFAPHASIVHIDIDPAEHEKNLPLSLSITCDADFALFNMSKRVPCRSYRDWWQDIKGWRESEVDYGGSFSAKSIMEKIRSSSPEETVIATEVGQHQMWAALHWRTFNSRSFITSGGQGAMGFGLPASIGAAFESKEPVVLFAGDGSFMMNCQELETAVRYSLPLRIFILNNKSLGMVRQWQELFWQERFSQTVEEVSCDFAMMAKSFGALGFRVEDMLQLEQVLMDISSARGPVVVDCRISQEDKVFPMVPAGAGLDEMILKSSN